MNKCIACGCKDFLKHRKSWYGYKYFICPICFNRYWDYEGYDEFIDSRISKGLFYRIKMGTYENNSINTSL